MKPDYSSPFYNIKGNQLLRNCYVDKGKKPLELEEVRECFNETVRNMYSPEILEEFGERINSRFNSLAKKIKFDDDEKVTMNEFIRLYCTRRI